jgi:hypothetical protein
MTTIPASNDYLLHVAVRDVPAVGAQHLLIESQWLAAKNPDERQTRLSLVLPPAQMRRIAHTILEAPCSVK